MDKNYGHKVYEKSVINYIIGDVYILTDPDLEFNKNLPDNFIEEMINISNYFEAEKVGFALLIDSDDIRNDVTSFGKSIIDFEKQYWSVRTPIGFILNLMLIMASVVGVVIVYQILYSNIATQFIAYATLKAIGYANGYLLNVVFQQALILALLGYIPGFIVSIGLYDFAMKATKLPIMMTSNNALLVLVSTVLICITSGALAINKLRSADPADSF
jgi:DevC protein